MANKNRMPLAMFVGSNHQLQNVVFGQALLGMRRHTRFLGCSRHSKLVWITGQFSLKLVHVIDHFQYHVVNEMDNN
jgi:hypothetical protein